MLSYRLPSWTDFVSLVQDIGLSFCPASVRRRHPPASTERVLSIAKITGLLQALAFVALLVLSYAAFMRQRAHQFGAALERTSIQAQSGALVLFTLDFLIHPSSLLLLYLAVEGFVRFLGSIVFGTILPSLPVTLSFKLKNYLDTKPQAVIQDRFEHLEDGERVLISSAHPKTGWNASITIDIDGQWYEIEKEEIGNLPLAHTYLLRPAPPGKVLRGYERYVPPPTEKITTL